VHHGFVNSGFVEFIKHMHGPIVLPGGSFLLLGLYAFAGAVLLGGFVRKELQEYKRHRKTDPQQKLISGVRKIA